MVITVSVDKSCKMASVWADDGEGMLGNYWDFHPGCHGIHKFGSFGSHHGLANAMKKYYEKQGYQVEVVYKDFKYGE